MKKLKSVLCLIMCFACMFTVVGCGTENNVIDITEKKYVSWINEIYTSPEDYLGKTIKITGMYGQFYRTETDTKLQNCVYRTGPGCCGNDGSMCGFEFKYSGDLPELDTWISVEGTLEQITVKGTEYLRLAVTKITETEPETEVVGQYS